jgi:hypothetical protein
MVSGIDLTISLDCMDTHIQIGSIVFLTGRALSDIVLVLASVWSHGGKERNHAWHSVRLKLSMWQHVQRVEKKYGFKSCFLGYFVSDWRRPAFGVTTRVA